MVCMRKITLVLTFILSISYIVSASNTNINSSFTAEISVNRSLRGKVLNTLERFKLGFLNPVVYKIEDLVNWFYT